MPVTRIGLGLTTMLPYSLSTLLLLIGYHGLPAAASAAASAAAWFAQQYATLTIERVVGEDQTKPVAVITTAPLPSTITPTTTITSTWTEAISSVQGFHSAKVNVTMEYLILPNRTDIPITSSDFWDQFYSSKPTRTIPTNYYVPVTIKNLPSCTKTEYTYTDSVEIELPTFLRAAATDESLASFVTTYASTISTNLGGQAATTTVCDVYLKSDAVPGPEEAFVGEYYLTECVDPRRSTCSTGENTAATGDGGCNGLYPPTAAAQTTDGHEPTPTGGAASWQAQSCWGLGCFSMLIYLLCLAF